MSGHRATRLLMAAAMIAPLLLMAVPGTAHAGTCQPQLGHRVTYTEARYRVTYVIRLCSDEPSVFYGSEVERRQSETGVIVNTDGLAPCRNRICHTTVGINHPAPEIAGYRSNLFWFIGPVAPVDEVPWQICATARGMSGCRSR